MISEPTGTDLEWRPLCREGLGPLSELLAAAEHLDDPADRHSVQRLRGDLDGSAGADSGHAIIGYAGESAIAYGWNRPRTAADASVRVTLSGVVHPAWRYHQIGRNLFAWQLDRARQWYHNSGASGGLRVETHADEHLHSRRRLYERHGLTPQRWYADLYCRLDASGDGARSAADALADDQDLAELRIVPFVSGHADAVRRAHNEAFGDPWGADPVSPQDWAASLQRRSARPDWSWVCLAGEEVVGYALNSVVDERGGGDLAEGWTDRLGVRPAWRGRGIARALLQRTLRSFVEAGLDGGGLGLDATERRLGLYESVGYRVSDAVVLYGRDVIGVE